MGCGNSFANFQKFSQTHDFKKWSEAFEALQISRNDLYRFYKVFGKVDLDGGGSIDLVEMLTVIDVERTPFTERVFSIFDDDKSGKIDFGEFVLALWNYNTLTRVSLGMFAFDLYDRDSSGLLEEDDLNKMMRDIYGKSADTSHYARQVAKELKELVNKGNEINLEVFLDFARLRQSLLFPAFEMQLALRTQILGVSFWEKTADRRVKLSKNKYITIQKLLELHASKVMQNVLALHSGKAKDAFNNTGTLAERRKYAKQKFQEQQDALEAQVDSKVTSQNNNKHGKKWGKVKAVVHVAGGTSSETPHHVLGNDDGLEGDIVKGTDAVSESNYGGSNKNGGADRRKSVVTHNKPHQITQANEKETLNTETNLSSKQTNRIKNRRQSV